MDQQSELDGTKQMPAMGLLRGSFFAMFGLLRATAIVAALAFAGAGGYIAYDLYNFLKNIVEEPEGIVREWQAVVHASRQGANEPGRPFNSPSPLPSAPAEGAPATSPGDPIVVPAPPVSVTEPAVAPTPPADGTGANTPPTPPALAAEPVGAPPAPITPAPETPPPAVAVSITPESTPASPAPEVAVPSQGPNPGERQENGRFGRPEPPQHNPNPWIDLADRLLRALEAGNIDWYFGLALLVAFCWILGKIPLVIITTGARVLVDLLKIGSEKA